jgi:hypothetical protein
MGRLPLELGERFAPSLEPKGRFGGREPPDLLVFMVFGVNYLPRVSNGYMYLSHAKE